MYNYLFYFFYSYYNRTGKKWDDVKIPFLATILAISVLLMFNFLFIRDFIMYQLNGIRYQSFEYENLAVPTIFIGLNYWYFKRKDRFKTILSDYKKDSDKNGTRFYFPEEINDLSEDPSYSDKVSEMLQELKQLQQEMNDPLTIEIVATN